MNPAQESLIMAEGRECPCDRDASVFSDPALAPTLTQISSRPAVNGNEDGDNGNGDGGGDGDGGPVDASMSPTPGSMGEGERDGGGEMGLPTLRGYGDGDGEIEGGRARRPRMEIPDSDTMSEGFSPVKGLGMREADGGDEMQEVIVESDIGKLGGEDDLRRDGDAMRVEKGSEEGVDVTGEFGEASELVPGSLEGIDKDVGVTDVSKTGLVEVHEVGGEVTSMKQDDVSEAVVGLTSKIAECAPEPKSVQAREDETDAGTHETESSSVLDEESKFEEPLVQELPVVVRGEDAILDSPPGNMDVLKELEVQDHALQSPSPDASPVGQSAEPPSNGAGQEDEVLFVRTNDDDTVMSDEGQAQLGNATTGNGLSSTGMDIDTEVKVPALPATTPVVELRSIPDSDDEELLDAPDHEETAPALPTDTNLVQVHFIPDNIDEELPDAPELAIAEDLPELKPKASKKGKGKANGTEKTTEKVAKKRGRPKKVVVLEVKEGLEQAEMDEADDDGGKKVALTDPEVRNSRNDLKGDLKKLDQKAKIATFHDQDVDAPATKSDKTDTKKGKSLPPSPQVSIPSSPAQRSTLQSPAKIKISPNPSFKMPSPVKKKQGQTSLPSSPSKAESDTNLPPAQTGDTEHSSSITASPGSQSQNKDIVLAELKAIKIASIQARIATLQSEIEAKKAKRDGLQQDLKSPAADTVKRHIKLLHDYNDIKDIGQGLVGMIADQRGLRIGELYEEFGVDLKD